jgi:hypothetical protein
MTRSSFKYLYKNLVFIKYITTIQTVWFVFIYYYFCVLMRLLLLLLLLVI